MTRTTAGRLKREHPSDEEPSFRKRRTKKEPEDRSAIIPPKYKVETDSERDESEEEVSDNDDYNDNDNDIPPESNQEDSIDTADLTQLVSIDAIIRFMDKIEPNKEYFERQKDNRDGCSKIRGKLRKFARKKENKDNDAVAFWLETNKWNPRNAKELRAIVQLLTTMIDESWPTLALGK